MTDDRKTGGEVDRFEPLLVPDTDKPSIHFRLDPAGDWMRYSDHAYALAESRALLVSARQGAEEARNDRERAVLGRNKAERELAESRAEVRALVIDNEAYQRNLSAESEARIAAEARAERLAEALREIAEENWTGVRPIQIKARTALNLEPTP